MATAAESAWFEALAARVQATPAEFPGPPALARAGGVSTAELERRLHRHAHAGTASWLMRARLAAATRALRTTSSLAAVAATAGFETPAQFKRAFAQFIRMTPEAYRVLVRPRRRKHADAAEFVLCLPSGYRATEVLAFHGRDPSGISERVTGRTLVKTVTTCDGPALLEIRLATRDAQARIVAPHPLGPDARTGLQSCALRLLGLTIDVAAFERRARIQPGFDDLLARRRGLHLPCMADPFEALCWAIIGQQINLAFATSLRRTLIELTGTAVNGMLAHPTPARVAALDETVLTARRFSRAKARYLIGAATAICDDRLPLDALAAGSAVTAEQALTELYGVGTWTSRYTLMRGFGLADCAPVGDVALAAALQKWRALDARPAPETVETLLRAFSPFRSLATCHLWASLKDEP